MILLVTGGRDYTNREAVFTALDKVRSVISVTVLKEGGARGADRIAREWAVSRGVTVRTYDADWKRDGKGAGPIRNQTMLHDGPTDYAVAFPGGVGTADMVSRIKLAGVTLWDLRNDTH